MSHIAIDLDDVVLDFMGGLKAAVETEYGVAVPDFDRWEISEILNPVLGKSWWKWMRERDWLWPNFPAMPGAIGSLAQLRDDGHYLEILTSKPEWAEYAVWKWLGKWRPPVQRVTIVGLDDVKVEMSDAEYLIDDKVENVQAWADDARTAVLFHRPHNANAVTPANVVRIDGWPRVVQFIRAEEAAR